MLINLEGPAELRFRLDIQRGTPYVYESTLTTRPKEGIRPMAMTDGTADRIRIEVSDFGPVGDAAFDLRPLTIFLGPSNAGKSYLALLIHALHQYGVDRSTAPHMYPIGQSSGSSKPLYLGEYFRSRGKELPPDMMQSLMSSLHRGVRNAPYLGCRRSVRCTTAGGV